MSHSQRHCAATGRAILLALLLATLATGCSTSAPQAPAVSPTMPSPTSLGTTLASPSATAATPGPTQGDAGSEQPSHGQPPSDQPGPGRPATAGPPPATQPAGRSSTSTSRFTAATGSRREPARWQDGVTATIVSTTTGKTTGFGAGSRVGRPAVTFAIRLSNGSAKIVDASQVVVGIRYGKTANVVGTPVYDDKTRDFSGDLAPKKATTARYTFEVPEPKSTEFVLTIDLDAAHEVATLRDRIK